MRIARTIPVDDFSDRQFDLDCAVAPRDLLVLCSTPRSGSTFLCDLLYRNRLCVCHEYFQNFQYMPVLAHRWGVDLESDPDLAGYSSQLRRYRTAPTGWLGINIHAAHLSSYRRALGSFADLRVHYVHLVRDDVLSQAVSYYIASRSGQWTERFASSGTCPYDFGGIDRCLERILRGNAILRAFFVVENVKPIEIQYERMVEDPAEALRQLPCVPDDFSFVPALLERQRSDQKKAYLERFSAEILDRGMVRPRETGLMAGSLNGAERSLRRLLRRASAWRE